MKLLLLLCLPWLAAAQSSLNFNNRVLSDGIDAPVSLLTLEGEKLAGADWRAQLWVGLPDSTLSPVGEVVGFRTGLAAGYVDVGVEGSRLLPYPAGTEVVAVIKTWNLAGDYAGESAPVHVTTGNPLLPPVSLTGLQPFTVTAIPEPSPALLLVLAALSWRRFRA